MCGFEDIGVPSIFNVIRSAAALARMLPTLDLRCEEKASLPLPTEGSGVTLFFSCELSTVAQEVLACSGVFLTDSCGSTLYIFLYVSFA